MNEPPDINYREVLECDIEAIQNILPRTGYHFTEKVLAYKRLGVELEQRLQDEYLDWIEDKLKGAGESENMRWNEFLDGLHEAVEEEGVLERDHEAAYDTLCARMDGWSKQRSAEQFRRSWESIDMENPRTGHGETSGETGGGLQIGEESEYDSSNYVTANETSSSPCSSTSVQRSIHNLFGLIRFTGRWHRMLNCDEEITRHMQQ